MQKNNKTPQLKTDKIIPILKDRKNSGIWESHGSMFWLKKLIYRKLKSLFILLLLKFVHKKVMLILVDYF